MKIKNSKCVKKYIISDNLSDYNREINFKNNYNIGW